MTPTQRLRIAIHTVRRHLPFCRWCWAPTLGWKVLNGGHAYACCGRDECQRKADLDEEALRELNIILQQCLFELRKMGFRERRSGEWTPPKE